MVQREGRLIYGPEEQYSLNGLRISEGDSLDILVGNTWIVGHAHYEVSDRNWYCDAGLMSIPLYNGREARFRLELLSQKQGDEEDLILAALGELGEPYEEDAWETEEFGDAGVVGTCCFLSLVFR